MCLFVFFFFLSQVFNILTWADMKQLGIDRAGGCSSGKWGNSWVQLLLFLTLLHTTTLRIPGPTLVAPKAKEVWGSYSREMGTLPTSTSHISWLPWGPSEGHTDDLNQRDPSSFYRTTLQRWITLETIRCIHKAICRQPRSLSSLSEGPFKADL